MPASVYGILDVRFEPRGIGGTKAPEPPIEAGFVIESADGEERIEVITDPDPESSLLYKNTILDFSLALEPGEYKIVRLIGQHPELGDDPVSFPQFRVAFGGRARIATLSFTVPNSGCIHIGRLSTTYFRVSPGSRAEQDRVLDRIANEIRDTVYYVYLKTGSVVAKSAEIKRLFIGGEEWSEEAKSRGCTSALTKWLIE